jgi:hypothetical protein
LGLKTVNLNYFHISTLGFKILIREDQSDEFYNLNLVLHRIQFNYWNNYFLKKKLNLHFQIELTRIDFDLISIS